MCVCSMPFLLWSLTYLPASLQDKCVWALALLKGTLDQMRACCSLIRTKRSIHRSSNHVPDCPVQHTGSRWQC